MIGETLGSYEIVEQIGVGGMGAVFLGRHKLIDRKVAIKVLLAEYSNREEAVSRFFNEAKATASLRHPSLVDVIDFGYAKDGSAFLVMEYLEGENLGTRLRKVGKLAIPQTLEFSRQIVMGIGVAHAAGIVHRDLKPDNVFLVPSPVDPTLELVKVLDFGIAKITGKMAGGMQKTQTGMMLGTPLYMAPEQCRGAGYVDARSDTYAFGCILFAMLTGRPPFVYEFPGELIAAHLHEAPPRVKSLRAETPQSLDDLVDKLLAKDPEKRPQTMAAITKALGKIAAEVGIAGTVMLPGVGYMISKASGQRITEALPTTDDNKATAPPAAAIISPSSPYGTKLLSQESAAEAFALPPSKGAASTTLSAGAGEVARGGLGPNAPTAKRRTPVMVLAGLGAAAAAVVAFVVLGSSSSKPEPAPSVAARQASPEKAVPTVPEPAPPEPVVIANAEPTPPTPPSPAPAAAEEFVVVRITNARAGLEAFVDGTKTSFPIKLPKSGKTHTLRFEAPNFHPETHSFKSTRNRVIKLEYKPFLFIE